MKPKHSWARRRHALPLGSSAGQSRSSASVTRRPCAKVKVGGTRLRKDSGAQLRGEDPGFLSDVKRFSNIAIGALTRGWMDGWF